MQYLAILPVLAALAMQPDLLAIDRAEADRLAATHALNELAEAGNTRAYVTQLESLTRDRSHPESVRTILLHDGLLTLADMPPVAEIETWLHAQSLQDRNLRTTITDEGHTLEMPVYDVGAAARFALGGWTRQRAYTHATEHLRAGSFDIGATFASGGNLAQREGYARAFVAATDEQLTAARDVIVGALNSGQPVESLALTVAVRLQDRGLAGALVERGHGRTLLTMLRPLADAFPAHDAFVFIESASRRTDIGSAAIAEMGRLAEDLPDARTWLVRQLGDSTTGSAAALALARNSDPALITDLENVLSKGRDDLRRSRAALALQLNGTPAARAALQRYAGGADPDDALQTEVRRWLR